jgi:hypothetical protein
MLAKILHLLKRVCNISLKYFNEKIDIMAKRQATQHISASFHYFVKNMNNDQEAVDLGFSREEFQRLVRRIENVNPIDFGIEAETDRIKSGENIPFVSHEAISENRHFGCFEGAYYGQEYRNTRVGTIDAESLNLRKFFYLLEHRRDGKIVVGVQYTGRFGDYDGIRRCFSHLLKGNSYKVISRSFSIMRDQLGDGEPVELKLNIRRQNNRVGGAGLFSKNAVFAIRSSEYGDGFADDVREALGNVNGTVRNRKAALTRLINNGEMLDIADDDIQGCTVIVRKDGRQSTVYVLGDSSFATKFPLNVQVNLNGLPNSGETRDEMLRVLDNIITPGLRR